jgi:hypothetical protein
MKQPEMPKGIDAAFPANIAEYMAAVARKRGLSGAPRRVETMTKTQRSTASRKKAKRPR